MSTLFHLSDLDRRQLQAVQELWQTLPVSRRRWIVRNLVELAEERVELYYNPIFRWLLEDPDAEVRKQAINGLWEDEDARLIAPLARLLREDPDEGVRAAAATALGQFVLLGELGEIDAAVAMGAERALLATIHTREESLEVRRRAVESIAYSSEAGVRDIIRDAYYDEDERMRISAVFAMGRSADSYWREVVMAELESETPAIRFEAARACGELELREAVPSLNLLLQEEEDVEIQQAALWALGRIGGPEARRILLAYAASRDEAIRDAAEAALEELAFTDDALSFTLFEFDGDMGDDFGDDDESFWDGDDEDEEAW
ncbi:MAG: HEAT repeat domain-containing protein [Anaerolineae bacterium]